MSKFIQKLFLVLALVLPALSHAAPSFERPPAVVTAPVHSDGAVEARAPSAPALGRLPARSVACPEATSVVAVQGDESPTTAARGAGCRYICQACSQFGWPDACARCATCGGDN